MHFFSENDGMGRFFIFDLYFRNACYSSADGIESINMRNWYQFACCNCAVWKHGTWFQTGMVCCHMACLFCSIGLIVFLNPLKLLFSFKQTALASLYLKL